MPLFPTNQVCNKALEYNPQNSDALMYRAKVHESREEYERAVEDLKEARSIDDSNEEVLPRFLAIAWD